MFKGRKLVKEYESFVRELKAAHFVQTEKGLFVGVKPNYYRHPPTASVSEIKSHFDSIADFLSDSRELRKKLQERAGRPLRSKKEKTALKNLDAVHSTLLEAAQSHASNLLEAAQNPLVLKRNGSGARRLPVDNGRLIEVAAATLRRLKELK